MQLSTNNTPIYLLWALFCLYGLLGSPTPEQIGITEYGMAILLLITITPSVHRLLNPHTLKRIPFFIFFIIYSLFAGLILGAVNGYEVTHIFRDIIAFGFLCLPLLLFAQMKHPDFFKSILWGSTFVGCAYACRFLIEANPFIFMQGGNPFANPHFSFLANEPLVFFSHLFLLYTAQQQLVDTKKNSALSLLFFILALLPLAAMVIMQQRATLALSALYWLILVISGLGRAPLKTLALIAFVAVALMPFHALIPYYWDIISTKNRLHGLNMRFAEWQAIAELLSYNPIAIIFGKGWGADFISPAVGNVAIHFTHNLFSMYWLKLGIIGVTLLIGYLSALLYTAKDSLLAKPVFSLTYLLPAFIGCFVYANFKSFGFGVLWVIMIAQTHPNHSQLNNKS